MEWIFEEGIPIYTQIVRQLKLQIANGTYAPGEKMPTVRELAIDAGVNPNTMQRAFAELERDRLLYSVRTTGRYVTEEKEILNGLKKNMSNRFINELFVNLKKLGMDEEEIKAAVKEWKTEEEI